MTKDNEPLEALPVSIWEHALMCVSGELNNGRTKHGPMESINNGWLRFLEEFTELREEVERATQPPDRIFDEAIQVAAMAIRLAVTATSTGQREPT